METPAYTDYIGLVTKTARSFHDTTGLDMKELMAEARLAFAYAARSWDPLKGKFSTLLVWTIRNHLISWAAKEGRRCANERAVYAGEWDAEAVNDEDPFQDEYITGVRHVSIGDATLREVLFKDSLNNLGKDAQMIARIVFHLPQDVVRAVESAGNDRGLLRHISAWVSEQGWTPSRVAAAYNELRALTANV